MYQLVEEKNRKEKEKKTKIRAMNSNAKPNGK